MKIEDIKYEVPTRELKIDGDTIVVKEYLSTLGKIQIMDAIEHFCFNTHIISRPKIDAIFNALIVLNYTNIEYDFDNEYELIEFYDYMEVKGNIIPILDLIPEIEYNALVSYYQDTVSDFDKFKTSGVALFANVMEFGPELMEKIGEVSKEIDINALRELAEITRKIN